MKNINNILSIILTLAITAGCLFTVVTVAADTNTFSDVPTPSTTTNCLLIGGNISLFAQSPDRMTQFAYDNNTTAANKKLYKSVDSGNTWSATPINNGVNSTGYLVTALAVSANYASDSTIVVGVTTTSPAGNYVYRSTNGGSSFQKLAPGTNFATSGTLTVTAMAYGLEYNGTDNICLVGTSDTTGTPFGAVYIWTTNTYVFTAASGFVVAATGANVSAIGFSPNYANDQAIYVVSANDSNTFVSMGVITNQLSGINVFLPANKQTLAATVAISGSFAFNSDFVFTSNNVLLVGVSSAAGVGGVYKVDFTGNTFTTIYSSGVTSIAIDSNGKVFAGLFTGEVRSTTSAYISSPATWTNATTKPFPNTAAVPGPGKALVVIGSGNSIIAATQGNTGGVYISADSGVTFKGTGLISISAALKYDDLAVIDYVTMFLLARDGGAVPVAGDHYMLFATADAGTTWSVVFNKVMVGTVNILGVYASPAYATDQTLFLPMADKKIQKSTNGGNTFSQITAAGPFTNPVVMTSFVAIDGSTFYVGYASNQVYRVNRATSSNLLSAAPCSMVVAPNGDVIVGTTDGNVYKSTDNAITFNKLSATTTAGVAGANTQVALASDYLTSGIVYATSADATDTRGLYMLDVANARWVNIYAENNVSSIGVTSYGEIDFNLLEDGGFIRILNPSLKGNDRYYAASEVVLRNINLTGNSVYAIGDGNKIKVYHDIYPNRFTIANISPSSGPEAGGTHVTITGTGYFNGITTVTIGGIAATNVVVVNNTSITATTPAGTAGVKDVVVTTPGGLATLQNGFTYITDLNSIPLKVGWNIFSTPISLDSSHNTLSTILAGLSYDQVYGFDSSTQSWRTLTGSYELKPCDAIYIHMTSAGTISLVVNQALTFPPTRSLFSGWNLISLAYLSEMKANEALASVYQVTGGLAGYTQVLSPAIGNQTGWTYVTGQTIADTGTNGWMQPAEGYWVFMVNAGTLAGFTTTP